MSFDPQKIEQKIDRAVTASMEIDDEGGMGLAMKTLMDALEFAKVFSLGGPAIPAYMRNNPGACLPSIVRAVRWRFDPYFCAEQSYITKNPKSGEERVAFQAQLITAVINAHAPIKDRVIRVRYEGEGENMKAICSALPLGATEPVEYETPTLGERIKALGRNESGKVKGSPLYDTDPKQQLYYYGSRGLCRRYFPQVLAGVFDLEDLAEAGDNARDVTPAKQEVKALADRMKQQRKRGSRGFDADSIEREASALDGAANGEATVDGAIEARMEDARVAEAEAMAAAFAAGKAAPFGAAVPKELGPLERERWVEGYHSVTRVPPMPSEGAQ